MNLENQRQSGFTMIEMMIVIVIIGILSGLSTVGFYTKVNRGKVEAAGDAVKGMLTLASLETKKSNSPHSIGFDGSTISLYDSLGCASNVVSSNTFSNNVSFSATPSGADWEGNAGGLPVGVTLPSGQSTWNWSTSCINFTRGRIGNAIESQGGVLITKTGFLKTASYVFKIDSDNRFQHYQYVGVWREK